MLLLDFICFLKLETSSSGSFSYKSMPITQYDDKEADTSHFHRSTSSHAINTGTCIYKAGAGIFTMYLLQLAFIFFTSWVQQWFSYVFNGQ